MREFIKVMKAVSDPNRVRILKMLQHRSLCVCEIQSALKVAQPTVSKHLRLLESAGLVSSRKDGAWVNYHLTDGKTNPYAVSILEDLKGWLDNDPGIIRLIEALPSIRREDICRKQTQSRCRIE